MLIPSVIGYLAIFTGTFVEGELALVVGGIAVNRGILEPWPTFLAALFGAYASDLLWFVLGRYKGKNLINNWPLAKKMMVGRPGNLIRKHFNLISFIMRFMYGLRTVVPLTLGMSDIPASRFLLWNGLGVIVWTGFTYYLGFYFGEILAPYLKQLRYYEHKIIIVVLGAIALSVLIDRIIKIFIRRYMGIENAE